MRVTDTAIAEVKIVETAVFEDDRGFFTESWNEAAFEAAGLPGRFVQDNHSRSVRGVLRGLHFQKARPQGKLLRVVSGEVFDVAVDVRRASPTFGRWTGAVLSSANRRQLWVPAGFAHGFLVLSERADVLYKCTEYYAPAEERAVLWNDPAVGIRWPLVAGRPPILSDKDACAPPLDRADVFDR